MFGSTFPVLYSNSCVTCVCYGMPGNAPVRTGPYDAKYRQATSPGKHYTALNMGVFMNIAYD